jgi:hypothetical protein
VSFFLWYLYDTNSFSCDNSQAELATTKAELAASEAVVKEQVSTEGSLYSMGEELQGEVHGRRDDVTKLLAKVAR